MAETPERLGEIRREIDAADKEIVRLILSRATLAGRIGEEKKRLGQPIYRPDREKEVYENILRYARESGIKSPLPLAVLEHVYREIMSGSLAVEGGPSVAFLGPEASFSHLAARLRFGSSVREYPVESIHEVFRSVESAHDVDYGIVPVDNTREGSIGATLDGLLRTDLRIYAEMYVRVRHNLLYHTQIPLDEIRRLYTLRIAAEQCREWLARTLPMSKIEVVETPSTAAAAKLASERKDGAAIASELAGEMYGLATLEANIHDTANNMTRFFIIGQETCPPTGDDKTSIICGLQDKPGSLYRLLQPFHEAEINLTRIESRATGRAYGDYNFYIDFLGHEKEPRTRAILDLIAERTSLLKILGSFPRANLP